MHVYMHMSEDMYKIKILTFPKINSRILKKARRQEKNRHKKLEKRSKNSAIPAPIWYNVNSYKNITKERIAL